MPHTDFRSFFPDIARSETRSITLPQINEFNIPGGQYVFIELYCDDLDCDCRNVYMMVMNVQTNKIEATICYGWEPLKFYMDWMGTTDENDGMVKDFKGPALAPFGEQSKYADKWLTIFQDILLPDKNYVNRLKKHYQLVKDLIENKK